MAAKVSGPWQEVMRRIVRTMMIISTTMVGGDGDGDGGPSLPL